VIFPFEPYDCQVTLNHSSYAFSSNSFPRFVTFLALPTSKFRRLSRGPEHSPAIAHLETLEYRCVFQKVYMEKVIQALDEVGSLWNKLTPHLVVYSGTWHPCAPRPLSFLSCLESLTLPCACRERTHFLKARPAPARRYACSVPPSPGASTRRKRCAHLSQPHLASLHSSVRPAPFFLP
jgi:hypothetical protein